MKNKKRKGFTLPEILVAVAILILLIGIAVPGYERLTQKSDVSDALHNLEMLSSAQNKYFISNGKYTRNLSSLQTPLKGSETTITTANFVYSAGAPTEGNNCVYSKSTKNDYTLAWNYKTHEGPLCSGSFCDEIGTDVPAGSLTKLCGTPFGEDCDLVCKEPQVLDEDECSCVCNNSCGKLAEPDANCSCKCIGQAVRELQEVKPIANLAEKEENKETSKIGCVCPKEVESKCQDQGLKFDASRCDCISCNLKEEDCKEIGKVLNTSKCICEESGTCDKHCPVGKTLNEEKCECECNKIAKCTGNQVFNEETCKCECKITEKECAAQGKPFDSESCSCGCSSEDISNCSSQYQELQKDCTCKCNTSVAKCPENHTWDKESCDCKCNLKTCPKGKVVDPKTCTCVNAEECSLTDKDCPKGQIVNFEKCVCEDSKCGYAEKCTSGIWDYRKCECTCDLTEEYCKKAGKELDEKRCECIDNNVECTSPWVKCSELDSSLKEGCCCNKKAVKECPSGMTFSETLCQCVDKESGDCKENFVQIGKECVCNLTEEYCSKLGKVLYAANKDVCECRDKDDVSCPSPWMASSGGCVCNSSDVKCAKPFVAVTTTSRCGCYCGKDEAVDCPESTYLDKATCECVSIYQCPNYNDVDCHEGYYDFSKCKCACDIDSIYCANAYSTPRVFDPATCSCVTSQYYGGIK